MSGTHTPGPWGYPEPYLVSDHELAAKARLIAASPEFLEACEKVAALNGDAGEIGAGMLCQLVDAARAAIAKAKGEALP